MKHEENDEKELKFLFVRKTKFFLQERIKDVCIGDATQVPRENANKVGWDLCSMFATMRDYRNVRSQMGTAIKYANMQSNEQNACKLHKYDQYRS